MSYLKYIIKKKREESMKCTALQIIRIDLFCRLRDKKERRVEALRLLNFYLSLSNTPIPG